MKSVIQHESLGEIIYEESAWTGSKSISINGQKLSKVKRNVFQTQEGETVTLKGNYFLGTKAVIGTETVALTQSIKWYEYVLAIIPFILIFTWGNSVELCSIVPIVGGGIGGAINGAMIFLNLWFIKKAKNIAFKVLIAIGVTGLCFLICYLVAIAILAAFQL